MSETRSGRFEEMAQSYLESEKETFRERLHFIINKPLTVETINTFAEDALKDLIVLVGEVTAEYKDRYADELSNFPDQATLENAACEEFGLTGTSELLDLIQNKVDQLHHLDLFIENDVIQSPETITPPDALSPSFGSGEGREVKKPAVVPRLKTLLYILETDFSIDLDDITVTTGTNKSSMMRELSYVTVQAPDIRRVVQVCDEEGNASYVFDAEQMEQHSITVEDLNAATKEEKNELIKKYPLLGIRVIQHPEWRSTVTELLAVQIINPAKAEDERKESRHDVSSEIKQKKSDAPKVSTAELDPWKGFWEDEQGKHWGPISTLGKMLGVSDSIIYPTIRDFQLTVCDIRDQSNREAKGFCLEDLRESLEGHLAIPQTERTGEWRGFYTDEDGRHWGPIKVMERKLKVSYRFIYKKIEPLTLSTLDVKDIGGHKVAGYCLEDVENALREHISSPQVEKVGEWRGFYADKDGRHWGAINSISPKLKVSSAFIYKKIEPLTLSTLDVKDIGGHKIEGYCLEDVENVLRDHTSSPQVEKVGEWRGFYADKDGRHWGPVTRIASRLGVSRDIIRASIKKFKPDSLSIRGYGGQSVDCFCLETIKAYTDS